MFRKYSLLSPKISKANLADPRLASIRATQHSCNSIQLLLPGIRIHRDTNKLVLIGPLGINQDRLTKRHGSSIQLILKPLEEPRPCAPRLVRILPHLHLELFPLPKEEILGEELVLHRHRLLGCLGNVRQTEDQTLAQEVSNRLGKGLREGNVAGREVNIGGPNEHMANVLLRLRAIQVEWHKVRRIVRVLVGRIQRPTLDDFLKGHHSRLSVRFVALSVDFHIELRRLSPLDLHSNVLLDVEFVTRPQNNYIRGVILHQGVVKPGQLVVQRRRENKLLSSRRAVKRRLVDEEYIRAGLESPRPLHEKLYPVAGGVSFPAHLDFLLDNFFEFVHEFLDKVHFGWERVHNYIAQHKETLVAFLNTNSLHEGLGTLAVVVWPEFGRGQKHGNLGGIRIGRGD
uniref:Uncharacterized protein n=1 Tax=Photinus pyralis TaxID=7054 RepID=A0A1Y1N5Z9_PHOPY